MPVKDLPQGPAALDKEIAKLRGELDKARLAHSLQKLDSPAKLRTLRRRLAQLLTVRSTDDTPVALPPKAKPKSKPATAKAVADKPRPAKAEQAKPNAAKPKHKKATS